MCGFGFYILIIYPAVVAVEMWESHAVLRRDFSKRLREATFFVAFRRRGISTTLPHYNWARSKLNTLTGRLAEPY